MLRNKKQGGFSLQEVLAAVAVIGITASVSAPFMGEFIGNGETETIKAAESQVISQWNADISLDGQVPADMNLFIADAGLTTASAAKATIGQVHTESTSFTSVVDGSTIIIDGGADADITLTVTESEVGSGIFRLVK